MLWTQAWWDLTYPNGPTNRMTWMGWQLPATCVVRPSAQLTFPRSACLVVGTSSTKWRSLPSSLWLALDFHAAPRRKGAAAEYPGVGKGLKENTTPSLRD